MMHGLTDRRLYTFGPTGSWPMLAPFIAGRVDEKLIMAHWEDVLRLAVSVRTGTASASLLLKRLSAYPRQNGLALALREIGRIGAHCSLWTGWRSRNSGARPRLS